VKLIEFKGVELAYGGAGAAGQRIGPLDLEVRAGESLGLVGESGAGKSTIGLEILGLLGYRAGRRTAGEVVRHVAAPEIAYVPQDPAAALDPLFSVGSQLAELGAAKDDVAAALRRVHLAPETVSLKSYPHEFSGGMRQRLVIAMALVRRPKLLIADEPTSSLDVTLQAEIMRLFAEIQASGVTLVFITHNLPLAAMLCARVAVLRRGAIVETGRTAEVFTRPRHEYTRALVAAVPRIAP
jgi:ABC-type glutathione transport system ATPase component